MILALAPEAAAAAAAAPEAMSVAEQTMADIGHLSGMMIIAIWSLLLVLVDAFAGAGMRTFQRRLALVGLALAAAATLSQFGQAEYDAGIRVFSGFLVADQFSLLLDLGVLAVVAAVVAFAGDYSRSHKFEYGEQESLVFIAAFGMMVLIHSADLLALFLGIETMSIAVYVLVGARWNQRESSEAALKYFLMGAFSSGLLVMGIALIYGATGSTNLYEVHVGTNNALHVWRDVQPEVVGLIDVQSGKLANIEEFQRRAWALKAATGIAPIMLLIPGLLLTLGGLLFKVSAVPFHMWTPDAYDGAPTPVTAFMAAGVKIAGVAALLKLFVGIFFHKNLVDYPYGWTSAVAVIALLTMTVGNLAAVRQSNVKRMLAYSSIAHVGYILIGIVAAASFYGSGQITKAVVDGDQISWARNSGDLAVSAVLFYVLTYAVATLGAFACVAWLSANKREGTAAHEWSGLASRHPGMALGMTICLLSLMGMPPTAGFIGKLMVFKSGLENTNIILNVLVVIALLNSVVAAYYYLRLIVNMYFRPPLADPIPTLGSRGAKTVVAAAAAASLVIGVGADWMLRRTELAAAGFIYPPGTQDRASWVDRLRERWEVEDAKAAEAEAVEAGAVAPAAPPPPDEPSQDPGDAPAAEGDAKPEDGAPAKG